MLIKVGIAIILAIGIVVFFWFKFSPSQQVSNFIPNISQQTTTSNIGEKLKDHQMPKLLSIEVKSGVDEKYVKETIKGFKIMDFYLNKWFGHSITKKSVIRFEVSNKDNKWAVENGTLVYWNRTLSGESKMVDQMEAQFHIDTRSRVMTHEYVHLFQFNNGCLYADRAGRSGERAETAKWFLEGEAEWLSYKASEEAGNLNFFLNHGQWLSVRMFLVGKSVKPLQEYDDASNIENIYPYFTLAIDFLMKNRDIKTLDDFCMNLGKGQDVPVAFQNAFNIPLTKFYKEFEAYFTKNFSRQVEKGGASSGGGDRESQIPQGYSSWEEFCKVQPQDSRCITRKP